eukprot:scaffold9921_cov112-Isochrysis_galbana.AAC.5
MLNSKPYSRPPPRSAAYRVSWSIEPTHASRTVSASGARGGAARAPVSPAQWTTLSPSSFPLLISKRSPARSQHGAHGLVGRTVGGARHLEVAGAREDNVALDLVVAHQTGQRALGRREESVFEKAIGVLDALLDEHVGFLAPRKDQALIGELALRRVYPCEGDVLDAQHGVHDCARVAK